jgi:hypothetical protein
MTSAFDCPVVDSIHRLLQHRSRTDHIYMELEYEFGANLCQLEDCEDETASMPRILVRTQKTWMTIPVQFLACVK